MTKIGRPLKHPPRNAAKQIEALAADGVALLGIAKRLGTSKDTLYRWFNENRALKEAFDNGRESERYALHTMLCKQATEKGNMIAAMFILKTRHGYRETDQPGLHIEANVNFLKEMAKMLPS